MDHDEQIVEHEWQQDCGDRFGRELCYIHPQLASFLGPAKPELPPRAPFFQWLTSLTSLPCLLDGATKHPPQFEVERALTAVITSETNATATRHLLQEMLRLPSKATSLKLELQLHGKRRHHFTRPQLTIQRGPGLVSDPPRHCDVSVSLEIKWANVIGPAATSPMRILKPNRPLSGCCEKRSTARSCGF
jgi:hypothetical protein